MKTDLYFIAILPTPEIREEVKAFKLYAKTHFNTARALRSPAHITLIPPFRCSSDQIDDLHAILNAFAKSTSSFYLKLKDFDCFKPRVIFVDVVENKALNKMQGQLLKEMMTQLNIETRNYYSFHPHMTIAFKDLRKSIFPEAWQYFSAQKYERQFSVSSIFLLHWQSDHWAITHEYLSQKD